MESNTQLIRSKTYWTTRLQIELYNEILDYMTANDLSKKDLAEQLGVSKSYVSQMLNGNFNHKLEKLVELSLAIGKLPIINYPTIEHYEERENKGEMLPYKMFDYYAMKTPFEKAEQHRQQEEVENGSIRSKLKYNSTQELQLAGGSHGRY